MTGVGMFRLDVPVVDMRKMTVGRVVDVEYRVCGALSYAVGFVVQFEANPEPVRFAYCAALRHLKSLDLWR